MNRIKLEILQSNSTISIQELTPILKSNPYNQGWTSQKFPVYPIIINLYITNPPFNRISLASHPHFQSSKITIQGSGDAKEYFKFLTIENPTEDSENVFYIHNLKEEHHYNYLRLKVHEPAQNEKNICKQVKIKSIEVTHASIFGGEFVCSLKSALEYDPYLFKLLEILQYKAILSKKHKNSELEKKYRNQIPETIKWVRENREDVKCLSEQFRESISKRIQKNVQEDYSYQFFNELQFDRKKVRQEIKMLQLELQDFYVNRLGYLHKDVTDYFQKYWNVEIKDIYLRLLSSPEDEDHSKALSNFWSEAKVLENYPTNIEEAIVMFLNYFLQYISDPLKITSMKVMCLFFTKCNLSFKVYHVYERLLFNLLNQLNDPGSNQQLFNTALKCLYILFEKVPNSLFLSSLLNPQNTVKMSMKLTKLQILEKLTFKNVEIENRSAVIDFLLDILLVKELSLVEKNRAYNVVAYLASIMGKSQVIAHFQKLNSMLLISMEKIIDKKLSSIKSIKRPEEQVSCEYCGVVKQSLKDPNLYDLHCFKECKYLFPCQHCQKVVEIPEMFKHYIHDCKNRNLFKECEDCNECYLKEKEKGHKNECRKMFSTKCPLCLQNFEGKLKLKEHILKNACPNNNR